MTETAYMRLFEILVEHQDDFTVSEISRAYNLKPDTVRHAVAKLQEIKLVVSTGEMNGRGKVYVIACQAASDGNPASQPPVPNPEEVLRGLMRNERYQDFTFKKPRAYAS